MTFHKNIGINNKNLIIHSKISMPLEVLFFYIRKPQNTQ